MRRCAAAAIALLVAGCGGGAASSTTTGTAARPNAPGDGVRAPTRAQGGSPGKAPRPASDADAITITVTDVLASGHAQEACALSVTAAYVRRAYGDRAGCLRAQLPGSSARSVSVSRIEISGDTARAVAVPAGGPSDGERINVALAREGGAWKVDALRSNVPVGP